MAILNTDGFRLAYDEYGKATSGGTMVLLHECALSRVQWEPQVAALRGAYRVLVPDMRGHGSSDVPSFVTSVGRMADDVRELVTQLETGPVTLVGHGMGGQIALDFALRYPALARALVLVGTRVRPDTREIVDARHALLQVLRESGPAGFARTALPKLLSQKVTLADPDLATKIRRMMETTSAIGIASAMAGIAKRPDPTAALGRVSVPTLAIAGADDAAGREESQFVEGMIPNARAVFVDGAGVLCNLEKPEVVSAELKRFAAEAARPAAPAPAEPLSTLTPGFATTE